MVDIPDFVLTPCNTVEITMTSTSSTLLEILTFT